jgi:hypothetical protein
MEAQMSVLSLRSLLADHANDLDQLLRDRHLIRPVSVLALVGKYHGLCGFPDFPSGPGLHTTAYTLKDNRRKLPLTWGTVAGGPSPNVNLVAAGKAAADVWQKAVPGLSLSKAPEADFTSPGSSSASIQISWSSNLGGFVGGNVTLGSTSPSGTSIQINNNNAVGWKQDNTQPGIFSLLATVTHELGHALGLLHSTSDGSVMNPMNVNIETPAPDDINGMRALYGWDFPRETNPVPNVGTDRGPALCSCGPVLAMAWKGITDDNRIFFSSSVDGLNWLQPQVVNGVGTSDSPSLAFDGTQLWMVWKGIPGDSRLFFARTSDPRRWPDNPGILIPNVGSSSGPAIAMTPTPMLAWKGIEGDSGIFFSTFGGANWQPAQQIPGVGTSDRPALTTDATGQPAVAGRPLLVWKGIEGDSRLFASRMLGSPTSANFWEPQQLVSWVIPGNGTATAQAVGFPGANFGPVITTDGNRVFAAWRGPRDDQGLWFTQRAPDIVGGAQVVEWSSQGNVPNAGTSNRPAAAFFSGRVHLAWKGIDGDQRIFLGRV